jgi:lipoprotein-anchoring transpeptidase ErfK/SrfK
MTPKKIVLLSLGIILALVIVIEAVAIIVALPRAAAEPPLPPDLAKGKNGELSVEADLASTQKKIQALYPRGNYIVVDSARNVLTLKKNDEVVRQAVVSCGSGSVLEEPGGGRKWIFDTPRGVFQVKTKLLSPTWIKPDWAFIEEGKKPPEKREERLESGVLGDYALGFGDGFFIHGTLYTRLLGRSVTHGCIRVGDADLKAVHEAAAIGTKIYIF